MKIATSPRLSIQNYQRLRPALIAYSVLSFCQIIVTTCMSKPKLFWSLIAKLNESLLTPFAREVEKKISPRSSYKPGPIIADTLPIRLSLRL